MADVTEGEHQNQELKDLPPPTGAVTDMSISDDDIDPEQAALDAAVAAAEAEEKAGAGDPPAQEPAAEPAAEPAPAPAVQPEPAAKPEPAPSSDDQPMIPKGRFDEVIGQRDHLRGALTEAEQVAAYWKGQADARAAGGGNGEGDEPTEQVPTGPDADIATARDTIRKAAKDADDGVITQAQLEDIRFEQEDVIDQARQQKAQAAAQPARQPDPTPDEYSPGDQRVLSDQQAELVAQHPYMAHFADDPAQRQRLITLAYADAKAEGRPIGTGAAGTMELRRRFAELSSDLGPRQFPDLKFDDKTPAASQPGGNPPPKPLSPQAQARKDKNDLRAGHPPDSSDLGSGGDAKPELTENDIESMTEEQLIELSDRNPAALQKFRE